MKAADPVTRKTLRFCRNISPSTLRAITDLPVPGPPRTTMTCFFAFRVATVEARTMALLAAI